MRWNRLEMEKQEREGERERERRGVLVRLAVVDRGRENKSNQKIWFLYHNHHSRWTVTPAGRARGIVSSLVRMSSKSISTLALPRSTLLALSQAGYETTDELVSSTAEGLARGKPIRGPGARRVSNGDILASVGKIQS